MTHLRVMGSCRTRTFIALAAILVVAIVVAACGGGNGGSGAKTGRTLNMAFSFDQGPLDPDIFYGSEGLQVTTSCYQGLLQYKDGSAKIVPALATDYTVSPDQRTYTFNLRRGVTFVDGTPFNSNAVKFSFARRTGIGEGPSYMVADVTSVDTSDPYVAVVRLSKPIQSFLHWMASPYGPKMFSPSLIKQHATGDDKWAEKWVANNCAGTGPYSLSNAVPGQSYTLAAYKDYWGPQPYYTTVNIKQIPNFSTQSLQLRSGELDIMTHGLTPKEVDGFSSDSNFQVIRLPQIMLVGLWINPHQQPFTNPQARKAVGLAIDRGTLDNSVYGEGNYSLPVSINWPDTLPTRYGGEYRTPYDPSEAKAIVSRLPASQRKIEVTYKTDEAINAQLAGLLASQLSDVGFDATSRGVVLDTIFTWPTAPESKRPQMYIDNGNADDASPTAAPQIFWKYQGGVDFFGPYNIAADRLIDAGLRQTSRQRALELYGKAMDMYASLNTFVPLANPRMSIVARKGITGFASQRQASWLLDLAKLRGDSGQ